MGGRREGRFQLAREIECMTEIVTDDLKATLLQKVPAVLKAAPLKITVTDPIREKVSTPLLETINKRELAALYSLMNYVAHN